MNNKYFIAFASAVMLTAACTKEEQNPNFSNEPETPQVVEMEFTAYSDATRTALDTDGKTVIWTVGDKISVYDGQANREFTAIAIDGASVTFKGNALELTEGNYYASYPYSPDVKFANGIISYSVPTEQTAVAGSFDVDANVSVASSSATDKIFHFKNICGLAMFSLDDAMEGVEAVKISGTAPLAGAFTADLTAAEMSVSVSGDAKDIVLSGVETGKIYYIPVLPSTHTGITFTLIKGEDTAVLSGESSCTFKSSVRTDFKNLKATEFDNSKEFSIRVLEGGGMTIAEGSEIPAEGVSTELYLNVNAADDVEWYITVLRNGVEWAEGQVGTGNSVTGTNSRWFKVPESMETEDVTWEVTAVTETEGVLYNSHTITFVQKSGLFRLASYSSYKEGDTIPAVVKEDGTQKDMYVIVYATEGLTWTGTVLKDGEEWATINGTGRLNQDSATSSHVWLPNNTTSQEITWTITVTTDADVANKTQSLTLIQAAADTPAKREFSFTHIEGAYTFYPDGENILPAVVASDGEQEIYAKIVATDDVAWTYTVTRNGEVWTSHQGKGEVTGTGDFWFNVTNNESTSEVTWVVTVTTATDVDIPTQSITIIQEADSGAVTPPFFTFDRVVLNGGYYTSDAEVHLTDNRNYDAYVEVSSNVEWTWKVYKDGTEYAGGTESGTPGGRLFWVPYSETEVEWIIVVTTEADVTTKEYRIVLTQKS